MNRKWSILPAFCLLWFAASAQTNTVDSVIVPAKDDFTIDTTLDYDELFRDFDAFMDSILTPRSYTLATLNMGKGYYNFVSKGGVVETSKKLTYQPMLGYYHKNGLGVTATGYIADDGQNLNFFQGSITPSFDYLQNRNIATGVSFTKFITKDSLPFYTTPLQNELYAYFTYRKWWVKPTISVSYGWGSRSDYTQREELIQDLRLRRRGFTYINTEESVSDFSIVASARHDFYWLDVFTDRDHIRLTPQLAFTSGTQQFGFNQSSSTYVTVIRNNSSVLYSTDDFSLDDKVDFQPLSLTLFLRGEYSIGKFFIQPQLTFDYYFPATSQNLSTLFSINAGFIF
jgi:hypothetical protein